MFNKKTKRITCLAVSIALAVGCACPNAFASTVAFVPGDANGDGVVTLVDAALIARRAANWDVTLDTDRADVNADDEVTLMDAVMIERDLVGGYGVSLGEQVTVTFNATANGGRFTAGNGFTTASGGQSKTLYYHQVLADADANGRAWPKTPVKTGCLFKGWYTAPTGGTKVTSDMVLSMHGPVTLYAQFGDYMETPEIEL